MHIVTTITELRAILSAWRLAGDSIACVPTMGNLHAGHLTLVAEAQQQARRVVVSIFVNPTQFGAGEDFASYPRTEREDQAKLSAAQVDVLFLPAVTEIYQSDATTCVLVKGLSDLYCGASRVGHFSGVATVVCKLFNIMQPDCAVFGLKDFQQLAVIRTMVRDLNIPVEIIGIDTVREANGLALSSRNGYLTTAEKTVAPILYQVLCAVRAAILAGQRDYAVLEHEAIASLQTAGFQPDYFAICRYSDLQKAQPNDSALVLLVAAKLGNTRLIDNVSFFSSTNHG